MRYCVEEKEKAIKYFIKERIRPIFRCDYTIDIYGLRTDMLCMHDHIYVLALYHGRCSCTSEEIIGGVVLVDRSPCEFQIVKGTDSIEVQDLTKVHWYKLLDELYIDYWDIVGSSANSSCPDCGKSITGIKSYNLCRGANDIEEFTLDKL